MLAAKLYSCHNVLEGINPKADITRGRRYLVRVKC